MAYQEAMQEKNLRKGPWLEEEDEQLNAIVTLLGERRWDALAKASGLRRSGKSCRLRWMNYLRPNLKHGLISEEEEQIILQLHEQWGNKWSKIAQRLPGRTDNELKNYWRSHLRKKAQGKKISAVFLSTEFFYQLLWVTSGTKPFTMQNIGFTVTCKRNIDDNAIRIEAMMVWEEGRGGVLLSEESS
ncbi:hypothetical protein RJ640_007113 [Escallonia rubra]|uniref:Uncharacterized protein n=1 Tax=Escallonia rubra TaxID=112253 RepID=A0AA88RWV6_9ASTE|nr:hypothetical protein RJ640_007113 [Escallonia rubra]